ncbi:MAG: NAD(P)/FAD-dependent oxidoreductase [Reyranella sp.]|nr:NAD(P)/FAD-dependent oxidoreductase [Reyranella sp.]MDP3162888.1 NAD(P)/FAD-dependent oxidoreductase [Reyranella sp.]
MSSVETLEVGVVGCGVAGQAAATLLADAGHRVTVFERFTEPRPSGAGLLLQPTGLAVLRRLGLDEQAERLGARIDGLLGLNHLKHTVLDLAYGDLHPAAYGLGIHRGALFGLLHDRLKQSKARLITDADVVDIVRDSGRATVVDKAGDRHGPFDLVVVADGAHSRLRDRLMPRARAPLYPWGCIWATVADYRDIITAPAMLQQRVRGTTTMMGLLPVGQNKVTLFWSLPVEELEAGHLIDLETWRFEALDLWPEAAALIEQVANADDFARATYRHVALPRWNDGPVLFIGDAAHGTSPQLGQGANLGLLDAHALSRALAAGDDLAAALALFARRRGPPVRFYRQASHLLTPFFQSRQPLLGLARDALLGVACRAPGLRPMMTSTLAGLRRGWLSADTLDTEGRYLLDS